MNTARLRESDLLRLSLIVLMLLVASASVLRLGAPRPILWTWAIAVLFGVFGAVSARSRWFRDTAIVGSALAMSLLLCEIAFAIAQRFAPAGFVRNGTVKSSAYLKRDRDLGYAPARGGRFTSRMTRGGHVVYDVGYTISDRGVRVTKGDSTGNTWIFMGCSFAFGEGVNDDETLASRFSGADGYRSNVVNVAFSGYGPHQMLRMLETDRVRPFVHGQARQVIYEAIWSHALRAAGRANWDLYGPAYQNDEMGVRYVGPLHGQAAGRAVLIFRRSPFFRFVMDQSVFRQAMSDDDVERFGRIVERSAQLAKEKYGAGFTVLYWDEDNADSRRILARLRQTSLPLVLVSTVIPRSEWRSAPGILLDDLHPAPEANQRLAAALAAQFGMEAKGER
jgi:hypothetical protein